MRHTFAPQNFEEAHGARLNSRRRRSELDFRSLARHAAHLVRSGARARALWPGAARSSTRERARALPRLRPVGRRSHVTKNTARPRARAARAGRQPRVTRACRARARDSDERKFWVGRGGGRRTSASSSVLLCELRRRPRGREAVRPGRVVVCAGRCACGARISGVGRRPEPPTGQKIPLFGHNAHISACR